MIRAIEAAIDERGTVLQEVTALSAPHRALVAILDGEAYPRKAALLSEAALTEEWNRPEEDAAWSHLQPVLPSVWG